MLHDYTPGLEAAGYKGEMADRGGNPFLAYVVRTEASAIETSLSRES